MQEEQRSSKLGEDEVRAAERQMVEVLEAAGWHAYIPYDPTKSGASADGYYPEDAGQSARTHYHISKSATGQLDKSGRITWSGLTGGWTHHLNGPLAFLIATGPVGVVVSPEEAERLLDEKERAEEEFNDRLKAILEERAS